LSVVVVVVVDPLQPPLLVLTPSGAILFPDSADGLDFVWDDRPPPSQPRDHAVSLRQLTLRSSMNLSRFQNAVDDARPCAGPHCYYTVFAALVLGKFPAMSIFSWTRAAAPAQSETTTGIAYTALHRGLIHRRGFRGRNGH